MGMKQILAILLTLSALQAEELTLMSKSTIFGVFKKNYVTPTCYDETFKRNGVDQSCFLMANGHKLHITRKQAKLYKKKKYGRYTIRCKYDQKAKVFHKCYIQK